MDKNPKRKIITRQSVRITESQTINYRAMLNPPKPSAREWVISKRKAGPTQSNSGNGSNALVRAKKIHSTPSQQNLANRMDIFGMNMTRSVQTLEQSVQQEVLGLRATFENNIKSYMLEMGQLNEQYIQKITDLNTRYQLNLYELKRKHQTSIDDAKRKCFGTN